MIGFLGADCILLALALAAIADQFDKGTLGGTPVVCVSKEEKALSIVHNISIRQ
jgi:hypothetical protein